MPVSVALRRHRVAPSRYEYFYLTVERSEGALLHTLIKPKLPGNNASTVRGPGSTNFRLSLGSLEVGCRLAGFLLPMSTDKFPVLTGPDIHAPTFLTDGTTVQTVVTALTGAQMRAALLDFVADIESADFDEWNLVWPRWGATASGRSGVDQVIGGVASRVWEGYPENLRWSEVSGESDQFMFSLDFSVGETS